MASTIGKNGKAHVFEISNRANIQSINMDSVASLNTRIDNHIGISNTSAHEISNISGLQAILNGKQDIISGYTGTIDIVVGVDFMAQTVTSKTVNVSNGIITSIA